MQNFWLFSFERFNGVLGRLPNNNRSVEVQMMRRFLSDADIAANPVKFNGTFSQVFFQY